MRKKERWREIKNKKMERNKNLPCVKYEVRHSRQVHRPSGTGTRRPFPRLTRTEEYHMILSPLLIAKHLLFIECLFEEDEKYNLTTQHPCKYISTLLETMPTMFSFFFNFSTFFLFYINSISKQKKIVISRYNKIRKSQTQTLWSLK